MLERRRRALELLGAFAAGALLVQHAQLIVSHGDDDFPPPEPFLERWLVASGAAADARAIAEVCLLYTSPSPRDATLSRMPSSA